MHPCTLGTQKTAGLGSGCILVICLQTSFRCIQDCLKTQHALSRDDSFFSKRFLLNETVSKTHPVAVPLRYLRTSEHLTHQRMLAPQVEVLAAQDYRNAPQTAVRQIPALRKVPELQSLLPPERRTPSKGGVKPAQGGHRDKEHAPGGYVPLMESASSVASVGLMDESQLQETAPVVRVSGELLRSQVGGDTSRPQPITM